MSKKSIKTKLALTAGALFLLTACAGGTVGSGDGSSNHGEGSGFEYGAPQEEVDAAIAELEPVTLTYQPSANSENHTAARSALWFKDYIEERSNGKITIDIVWGQAIAGYGEIDDALVDGRVDIAYNIVVYTPEEYPVFDALGSYGQLISPSPLVGELTTSAVMAEMAWESEDVISEFTDKGLSVLSPMLQGGEVYAMCNPGNAGATLDDWKGRSIRAGSQGSQDVLRAIGSNPVSMHLDETYEGLQRGTVDCTLAQFAATVNYGIPEIAPNITHLAEGAVGGRASNALVVGTTYENLPLAYQQIIFDAEPHSLAGYQHHVIDTKGMGMEQAVNAGGTVEPFPKEAQQLIDEAQAEKLSAANNSEWFDTSNEDKVRELDEKWTQIVAELGYEDGGTLDEMNDWYDPEEVDFLPFAEALFEDVALPHRPN